ncbi:hypothetical protein [Tolypothrix sp. VBCCA 56010]|uniref:hypothetical protein n=1 Tax=Tolypothrix sp. VBCCA 56010 TaxID=3137731 RepID=UPI003D7C94EC
MRDELAAETINSSFKKGLNYLMIQQRQKKYKTQYSTTGKATALSNQVKYFQQA